MNICDNLNKQNNQKSTLINSIHNLFDENCEINNNENSNEVNINKKEYTLNNIECEICHNNIK